MSTLMPQHLSDVLTDFELSAKSAESQAKRLRAVAGHLEKVGGAFNELLKEVSLPVSVSEEVEALFVRLYGHVLAGTEAVDPAILESRPTVNTD